MRDHGQRGAATVELAIVLPLLVFLLFGIIEFGLIIYNQQIITNASREGARAGIAHAEETEIQTIVESYCENRFTPDLGLKPVTVVTGELGLFGQDLTVAVSYGHTFLFPALLGFGTGMSLTAETVMKMESVAGP